jgi:hypothetical protein
MHTTQPQHRQWWRLFTSERAPPNTVEHSIQCRVSSSAIQLGAALAAACLRISSLSNRHAALATASAPPRTLAPNKSSPRSIRARAWPPVWATKRLSPGVRNSMVSLIVPQLHIFPSASSAARPVQEKSEPATVHRRTTSRMSRESVASPCLQGQRRDPPRQLLHAEGLRVTTTALGSTPSLRRMHVLRSVAAPARTLASKSTMRPSTDSSVSLPVVHHSSRTRSAHGKRQMRV